MANAEPGLGFLICTVKTIGPCLRSVTLRKGRTDQWSGSECLHLAILRGSEHSLISHYYSFYHTFISTYLLLLNSLQQYHLHCYGLYWCFFAMTVSQPRLES